MTGPRRNLIIFAKAPRYGAVKSRLAAGIGEAAALRFYRATTDGLIRRVARDPRWRSTIWVTPDGYAGQSRFWPRDIPRRAQGGSDLGARMLRALAASGPGPALLIGSDIPGIRADHLAEAFALLGRNEVVFGPAEDGGFWLVGLRRPDRHPGLFQGVRWSTGHALADCLANIAPGTKVGRAAMLADVDDAAGYARMREG
ncbi:MAG: TIGR04282 family arsenosugar biosynthesis glycosyltransferase [Proteobacteria bacterium]|nr:TIGR04282 family arsenosugar biosynthesis glycosyltransferase [Pseudomonadota bacterium]